MATLVVGIALVGGSAVAQSPVPGSMPPGSMAPASVAPSALSIAVTLADFTVTPNPIEATGLTASLDVTNAGPTPHNLTIRDEAGTILGATPNLSTGEVAALVITVPAGGTYVTFCSLPGHESLGLRGELIVTEADTTGSPGVEPMASPGASLAA